MYSRFKWTQPSSFRNAILRAYEPVQPFVLVALAERLACDTFIDVGANIGAYSLFMTTVPTIEQVHAFEPSPDTYTELTRNIALNGAGDRISAHKQAVSNSNGTISFGLATALSGTNGVIATSIHEGKSFKGRIEVDCVKLDNALPLASRRICVKIDVEGHERDALLGMRGLLNRNTVVVQIEHYDSGRDYMDIFEAFGFRRLAQLGPDLYVTNAAPSEADVVGVFERASELMIEEGKARLNDLGPVEIRIAPGLSFRLDGSLAKAAQGAKASVRRLLRS